MTANQRPSLQPQPTRPSSMIVSALAFAALALSGGAQTAAAQMDHGEMMAPPGDPYKKVSNLVELPDFIPGVGVLYVNPATLPAGPFLAYDRDGHLVSTVYMIPLAALNGQQTFDALGAADAKVDHVDLYYNAGHPGVPSPHYHIVLWHVSKDKAASLQ